MKKTIFKGVLNGTEFDNVAEYNAAIQEALAKGEPISASTSTQTIEEPDPVVPGKKDPSETQEGREALRSIIMDLDDQIKEADKNLADLDEKMAQVEDKLDELRKEWEKQDEILMDLQDKFDEESDRKAHMHGELSAFQALWKVSGFGESEEPQTAVRVVEEEKETTPSNYRTLWERVFE